MTQFATYFADAQAIINLRVKTNAPMLDCRQALIEASGDVEKAKDILEKRIHLKEDLRQSDIELYR